MSRSNHNRSGKGPGYDYWSRRAGNRGGASPGKYGGRWIKTRTHRLERRAANRERRVDNE